MGEGGGEGGMEGGREGGEGGRGRSKFTNFRECFLTLRFHFIQDRV